MLKQMTEKQLDEVARAGESFGKCLVAYDEVECFDLILKEIKKYRYDEYFDASDIFTDQTYVSRQRELERYEE